MNTIKVIMKKAGFAILGSTLPFFATAQITLHYNERPPYAVVKDGQLSGLIGSPAAEAFKAAGIQYTLSTTPVSRQLYIFKENSGLDCGINWFKNEERESFGKFTKPLYEDKARIALTSANNTKVKDGETLESVLGNKSIKLLVKQGLSYGKALDDLILKLQPVKTEVTVENIPMLKMIQADRADLLFISQEEADGLISAAGINAADIRKIHFSNAPKGENRHILCSKKVPDEIIMKLNKAIK